MTNAVKIDATVKITKGKKVLELTLEETKDLFRQLNEIVGDKLFIKSEGLKDGRTK